MEMKRVACTLLFAAAAVSAVVAADGHHDKHAPAPAPASDASALGSFIGASLLSFVAYYMQF
ncbi:PREDICTED: arabinogalactan peptide 23-like [Lupinus angustifolius]|uniref:arabinogalactan peptide 23-like n=1 Tax=Lupinus angustifolius TaxID=3871 RepID=UPI00092F3C14|nr:PREDICTED: arabinogalactan peptide 23-like [Lupinus angustifolius]